jgi:hypothetical protein
MMSFFPYEILHCPAGAQHQKNQVLKPHQQYFNQVQVFQVEGDNQIMLVLFYSSDDFLATFSGLSTGFKNNGLNPLNMSVAITYGQTTVIGIRHKK